MRDKIVELIKSYGTFNGNIMGVDTYIVFEDDLVDALVELFKEQNDGR